MIVGPGTVQPVRGSVLNTSSYSYQACFGLSNSSSIPANLSKMEFTPTGPDGSVYATQTIDGGFSVVSGQDYSGCWGFTEFNSAHGTPTTYRLRFTFYYQDNPTLRFVEGTSTLTPLPFRG
jgi:hypothetical protein